jgi:hypothetical protein
VTKLHVTTTTTTTTIRSYFLGGPSPSYSTCTYGLTGRQPTLLPAGRTCHRHDKHAKESHTDGYVTALSTTRTVATALSTTRTVATALSTTRTVATAPSTIWITASWAARAAAQAAAPAAWAVLGATRIATIHTQSRSSWEWTLEQGGLGGVELDN